MDKGRFLIETHLRTKRPIAELAAAHGVSRSWRYKLLARYRTHGPAGLEPRSRRPLRSPTRIADVWEDRIIELRKELNDLGVDAGPATIAWHLEQRDTPPSLATIWRVLKQRGFVTPQPHKRPKSSFTRFEADLPNQRWQADVTHWALADGTTVEILNIIDDHSRLCVTSRVFRTARSADVVRALHRAGQQWGYPQSMLTDNGSIFTASDRGGTSAMETELLALGIASKHSRPYHAQTCGKVERFHQTVKKWLAKQDPTIFTKQLQRQLEAFADYYNHQRPHRALNRRTPAQAFAAREHAYPTRPLIDCSGYLIRHDRIDRSGRVTLRRHGRLHHIGIGNAYRGWRVIMLIAGLEIRILDQEGNQLRRLTLDPTKDYQPIP